MAFDIFVIVLWVIAGILTLCSSKVSKGEYAMVWALLILNMIGNCLGV